MHCLRYNQVLLLAGNDVIVFSPLGALQVKSECMLCKGDYDFILVNLAPFLIHSSFTICMEMTSLCYLRKGRCRQILNLDFVRVTATIYISV